MNFMLLTAEVSEEVVQQTNQIPTIAPSTFRLIVLGVIVVGICIYFIFRPTNERKNMAKKYLNSLATNILGIVLANLDFKINTFTGKIETNFEDFKKSLVDEIYKESWDFVETVIKKAVKDGKIDSIAAKYIKKESVESLVDLVISREDIVVKFKKAYDRLSNEVLNQIMKEEEKARLEAEAAEEQEEEPGEIKEDDSIEAFAVENIPETDSMDLYEPVEMSDLAEEIIKDIDKDAVG